MTTSARQFVAGIDDFDAVLRFLEGVLYSRKSRTHERALALFEIIEWCVVNGREIPTRVGMDLLMAYDLFMSVDKDAKTLNGALGLKRPTKGQRGARLRDWPSGLSTAAAVVAAVERLKADGVRVDDALFEKAGAALSRPVSGPSVKKIYYANHDAPEVFLEQRAYRMREAREAAEALENKKAAAALRKRLGISKKARNS